MSHTRTLTFTPAPDIERHSLIRTSVAGFDNTGLFSAFNRATRPTYAFKLTFDALTKTEVDCLTGLHHYHMGAKSFFWDGGHWGRLDNYTLIAEANGQLREFFLPNRNIGVGSISVRTLRGGTNSVWATTAYSLFDTQGFISFANSTNTIPSSGDDIQAQYSCQYRVFFDSSGLVVKEIAPKMYSLEIGLIETSYAG